MLSLYKVARRRFSTNQYHHGLEINDVPRFTLFRFGITAFEMIRVVFYFYLTIKVLVRSPSYITYNILNFKKSRNNPDYMLCDEATFKELNNNTKI